MFRVSPWLVCGLLLVACGDNNEQQDAGTLDAGRDAGVPQDAGQDAGEDAGVQACSLADQNCAAGTSCLEVETSEGVSEPACVPGECDLVRQECGAGRKCSYLEAGGVESRACMDVIGDGGVPCQRFTDGGMDTCLAGFYCLVPPDEAEAACVKFCYSNDDCTATQRCTRQFNLPQGSTERPRFCFEVELCDPFGATPCSRPDAGCYPTQDPESGALETMCLRAGTVPEGGNCTNANDCVAGTACFQPQQGGQSVCRALCNPVDGGMPGCTTGRCSPVSNELGACVP